MSNISNKFSWYSWLFCLVLMCYSSLVFYPRWKQEATEATISYDVSGYYWYLPSVFIYHDLKHQSFKDTIMARYRPTEADFQQATKADNGNYVLKYSSGMAVMYAPFFFTAHLLAGPLGYQKDGFSPPYQVAIQLGGLLISLIGLWYLRKLLLLFYEDKVVAATLLVLVAGTNYVELSSIDSGMSHTWLFTIYVFLLLNTYYFHRSPSYKYAIRIGLLIGLATLTRPTDIVCCLIPLLWGTGVAGIDGIRDKLRFLGENSSKMLAAALCMIMVASVQLIYWKYVSGHWIVYSYGDQGFSFADPNFRAYTFSFRSGWLIYTPMMALAGIGVIPFLLNGKNRIAIVTFAAINYYVVCAWNIWYYGGRAMVQSYPVLVFFIAALMAVLLRKKILLAIAIPFLLLFTYLNAWIIYQHHIGKLYNTQTMKKPYYKRVAGRWTAPAGTVVLQDSTDLFEGTPKNMRMVYENYFEKDTTVPYVTKSLSGNHYYFLKAHKTMPEISIPFTNSDMQWIRIWVSVNCDMNEWNVWQMPQLVARLTKANEPDRNKNVDYNMVRMSRLLESYRTRTASLDMKLPKEHFDTLKILIDNYFSDQEFVVDSLRVAGFNE